MKVPGMFKTVAAVAIVFHASSALAGMPPDLKCKAGKNKIVGAYYACRQKAEATAIGKETSPNYSKCSEKFLEKWGVAETKGAGMCPDNVTVPADVDALIAAQAAEATAIVAGATPAPDPECGDDDINVAGEHCDGTDLDGATCADFGLYGTLACTAGCGLDLSGCTTCPAGSLEYASSCWVLGAVGADCDTACAAAGMVYSETTKLVAGSDGSDVNCIALLDAFGTGGVGLDNVGDCAGVAMGCAIIPGPDYRARCVTPATTSTAAFVDAQRVCACE